MRNSTWGVSGQTVSWVMWPSLQNLLLRPSEHEAAPPVDSINSTMRLSKQRAAKWLEMCQTNIEEIPCHQTNAKLMWISEFQCECFETCLHSQAIFSWEVDQRRMREVVPGIQWIWVEITLACQTPSSFSSPIRLSPQFAVPTLFSSCIWNKPLLRRQFFSTTVTTFMVFQTLRWLTAKHLIGPSWLQSYLPHLSHQWRKSESFRCL